MYRLATLASVLLLLSASLAPSVLAQGKGKGKGQNAPAYGIVLEMVNDANGDDLPNFGDTVKFNVSTTATTPFVSLSCYQGTTWVYAAGGYQADWNFTLSSNSWPGVISGSHQTDQPFASIAATSGATRALSLRA